jgi:hypothetical protein
VSAGGSRSAWLLAGAVLIAACGDDGTRAEPSPAPSAPSSVSGAPPRPAPATCATAQLRISEKGIPSSAGHAGVVIVFENDGDRCVLRGYPGVDGMADGSVVFHAERSPGGYLGGAEPDSPEVELNTGGAASALLEGLHGPPAGEPPCPRVDALAVTPPDETHSFHLEASFATVILSCRSPMKGRKSERLRPPS